MTEIARLRDFVRRMTRLVDSAGADEARILEEGRALIGELVRHDDWLPEAFAEPDPATYRQYLLHCDPLERLSVVSFVWGPGQATPIHDHTVWGLIGVLRGEETAQRFIPEDGRLVAGEETRLRAGEVDAVSPGIGDVHRVFNRSDRVAVSIHAYGANIGAVRRHLFDPETGEARDFVSGYSSAVAPNLWDRAAEMQGGT